MALPDALRSQIRVDVFDAISEQKIWASLDRLYDNSPTMRALFLNPVSFPNQSQRDLLAKTFYLYDRAKLYAELLRYKIVIIPSSEGSYSLPGTGFVALDPNEMVTYFSPDGTSVRLGLETGSYSTFDHVLGHELSHNLTSLDDGEFLSSSDNSYATFLDLIRAKKATASDLQGPNVVAFNQVLKELGLPERLGYVSGAAATFYGYNHKNWTDSNIVKAAFAADTPLSQIIDYSYLDGASLLFGAQGNDQIYGSKFDDYLYGGEGNDIFYGGAGSDYINGGRLELANASDGFDTVSYEKSHSDSNSDKPGSIRIQLGSPGGEIHVDDGLGGVDRLISIEKIVGTGQADTIELSAITDGQTEGSKLIIDLGAGVDSVNVTDKSQSYIIDLRNGRDQTVQVRNTGATQGTGSGTGPTLHLRNAEDGYGSSGNDVIFNAAHDGKTSAGKDPLILDLNGDGVRVAELDANTSPLFDIDGDGIKEIVSWATGGDGFLARDLNNNGKLDGINELFGRDDTSGFADLATLDSNADGVIDANDTAFSSLRVWIGVDGETGQFKTLAELGIQSISLTTRDPNANEATINGNEVTAIGSYTRTDGTTRFAETAYN